MSDPSPTPQPWTAETVELVARALWNNGPLSRVGDAGTSQQRFRVAAEAVLAALHGAGLLLSSSLSHVGWIDPHAASSHGTRLSSHRRTTASLVASLLNGKVIMSSPTSQPDGETRQPWTIETLELVARAIFASDDEIGANDATGIWETVSKSVRDDYRANARVVLAALDGADLLVPPGGHISVPLRRDLLATPRPDGETRADAQDRGEEWEPPTWQELAETFAAQRDQARAEVASLTKDLAAARDERDEAKRVIRNAHRAIRENTTAAAVALAMFDTGDTSTPSLLDELTAARAEVASLTEDLAEARSIAEQATRLADNATAVEYMQQRDVAIEQRDQARVESERLTEDLAAARAERQALIKATQAQIWRDLAPTAAERRVVEAARALVDLDLVNLEGLVADKWHDYAGRTEKQAYWAGVAGQLRQLSAAVDSLPAQHSEETGT